MSLRHLSEETMQAFLEDRMSSKYAWVPAHLESCDHCKRQLKQYEILFKELQQEVEFKLSENFAEAVLQRIQPHTSPAASWGLLPMLISGVGLLLGLAAALYFMNAQPLLLILDQLKKFLSQEILAVITKFAAGLNLDLSLFGLAVLVLVVISAIDHFILQSRRRATIVR
jgi:hypothetical protein